MFLHLVIVMMARRFPGTMVVVAALLGITLPILPSAATRYRPPTNLQRPSGRQGAATRTDCVKDQFVFEPILPTSNYGQTIAKYPTLYWYLSHHGFSWARFDLYATQNLQPETTPMYSKIFSLGDSNSLHQVTLPKDSSLSPLEVGRDYLWKVTLICSALGPDDEAADGSQRSIQGWITTVAPSATLQKELSRATRKYDVYAEKGLWYDAIHDLAERRKQQPQDTQLANDWQNLLKETHFSLTRL